MAQFSDICTSSERIESINITGMSVRMVVNVMQGRELVREGNQATARAAVPRHWPRPYGWDQYLQAVFPPTEAVGGWTIGPVVSN